MNEFPTALFGSAAPLLTSCVKTNQVMVGQFEKWLTLSMDSLKAYVDLGMAQIKVGVKVNDPHSLHEFSDSQFAVMSFMVHRVMDDGQRLAEWSKDCYYQANRVTRENMLHLLFKD